MLSTAQIRQLFEGFCQGVLDGSLVAGKPVRQAVQRHINDLRDGPKRGLIFDWEAAAKPIRFCALLKQSKGEWAGKSLDLSPFQIFIVGSLFGWLRSDGTRRYKTSFIELGRKSGKSTLAAALCLYALTACGEACAEVYCASTHRLQSKIVFGEAVRMAKASPSLKKHVTILRDSITVPATSSRMGPLGADADSLDGLSPSMVCLDECHAIKNRLMFDVLKTAMGARRSPLMFIITTAGYRLQTARWEDGSQAWIDSRGLLHLRSSHPRLPEATLVLEPQDISGWCSDGRRWGSEYFIGDHARSLAADIHRDILEPFVARLQ